MWHNCYWYGLSLDELFHICIYYENHSSKNQELYGHLHIFNLTAMPCEVVHLILSVKTVSHHEPLCTVWRLGCTSGHEGFHWKRVYISLCATQLLSHLTHPTFCSHLHIELLLLSFVKFKPLCELPCQTMRHPCRQKHFTCRYTIVTGLFFCAICSVFSAVSPVTIIDWLIH